jgi:predicted outer membrane repeat protein
MKKLMMAMSAALMLTACGKHETDGELTAMVTQQDTMKSKTITFTFGPEMRQMTRASLAELNITDLWLFDYVGDELKQTVHKSEVFDAVSLSLDYGEHTLCFVASRGSEPTVSAPTISWSKPSDTFWAIASMNIQPASSASQSVGLKRVATRLKINITDEIPVTAARLEVEPATWYYGLNVRTGEAVDARRQVRSVSIPSQYIGTTGQVSASFFGLSPNEWQSDVDVRLVASDDGILGQVSLADVQFRRNTTTVFGGGIVCTATSVGITADDAWKPDDEHTW